MMKISSLRFSVLASLILSSSVVSTATLANDAVQPVSNQAKAIALLNSIETGDQTAVAYVNPTQYTQHNLAVADGLAGFGELLQALPKGSAKVDVKRSFTDGDYVVTHTAYNFFGPKVGFDLFRFENGLIVEHWDNLTVTASTPNPSGHTQLDGVTQITDLEQTKANKQLVKDFVATILVNGQMDKIGQFIDADNYIQHNPNIADGLAGLSEAFAAMAKQGIKMVYDQNHKIVGQGNFVLSISEGSLAGQPTSFYDLFRVADGKIVEHWDTIETIPAPSEWKNQNGKFGGL